MIKEEQAAVVDFIQKVHAGENVEAGQSFTDMMMDRINNALANIKIDVAKSMFSQDATIGEDADDEDDSIYLTQDEYDALPEEEKAEWDKLPEEIEVEEETLAELSPALLKRAASARSKQSREHGDVAHKLRDTGDPRADIHDKARYNLAIKGQRLASHAASTPASRAIDKRAVKYARKSVREDIIKEYSRGLWRPPAGMNKSTGVEKGPGKVIAGPSAAAPTPKPVKTAKPKKAAVTKPAKPAKPTK